MSEIGNWSIALFEAGGEEPAVADIPAFGNDLKLSNLDWQYWTQPQSNACAGQPCQWPRGKVLGGGSTINDMIYNRGNKYDYDGWANLGTYLQTIQFMVNYIIFTINSVSIIKKHVMT